MACACSLSGGCACEAIAKLTPAQREEVQEWYLRSWLAKRKRAAFQQKQQMVRRYDHAGQVIGERPIGRMAVAQDQMPRGSQTRNYQVSSVRTGGPE